MPGSRNGRDAPIALIRAPRRKVPAPSRHRNSKPLTETIGLAHAVVLRKVTVDGRCEGDGVMAEVLLQVVEAAARHQKVRGVDMPEVVQADAV